MWAIVAFVKKIFRWSLTSEQELPHPAVVIAIRFASAIFADAPLRRENIAFKALKFLSCINFNFKSKFHVRDMRTTDINRAKTDNENMI